MTSVFARFDGVGVALVERLPLGVALGGRYRAKVEPVELEEELLELEEEELKEELELEVEGHSYTVPS